MKIGYARVSTKSQLDGSSLEAQERELLAQGCEEVYKEQYTGSKTNRPIFNEVIEKLEKGSTLVVTKLDRFARSTTEGIETINKLMKNGVKIHILNMGLIEDTPVGRLIVTQLLAFGEFERAMIIERTQEGKAIAKTKEGYKEGRPQKYTKSQLNHAMELLKGYSYTQVEEMTRISKSTLTREKRKRG